MGLITTMGKFSYIECDTRNCSKKIEKSGENQLKELAFLCGWEFKADQWMCPACVEKERSKKKVKKSPKPRQKTEAHV